MAGHDAVHHHKTYAIEGLTEIDKAMAVGVSCREGIAKCFADVVVARNDQIGNGKIRQDIDRVFILFRGAAMGYVTSDDADFRIAVVGVHIR